MTTFLQTLLAQDPRNITPLSWQTMQPYPDGRDRVRDRRVQRRFIVAHRGLLDRPWP